MPRLKELTPAVRRGMDVDYYDPGRKCPKMGRPGKVTGIAPTGRVHITIWNDPALDSGDPVQVIENVRLLPEHEQPDLHERYARLIVTEPVMPKRPRGRPRKTPVEA